MHSYAVKARMPRNARAYFSNFSERVLGRCEGEKVDCVLELIDGRILLFTDSDDPQSLLDGIKGIISVHRVKVFEDVDSLIEFLKDRIRGCESFSVRSNKKAVEQEIGGRIHTDTGVTVNLTSPHCPIYVEKRGKFYILFEE